MRTKEVQFWFKTEICPHEYPLQPAVDIAGMLKEVPQYTAATYSALCGKELLFVLNPTPH